jgi:hypothetical protein
MESVLLDGGTHSRSAVDEEEEEDDDDSLLHFMDGEEALWVAVHWTGQDGGHGWD